MKKLMIAAAVLALAGMNLQSAQAGVSVRIDLGLPLPGLVAVRAPLPFPAPPLLLPVPVLRPAAIYGPPVVIREPRPVCVTSENFVAARGDFTYGPRYGHDAHRFGRDYHHYR